MIAERITQLRQRVNTLTVGEALPHREAGAHCDNGLFKPLSSYFCENSPNLSSEIVAVILIQLEEAITLAEASMDLADSAQEIANVYKNMVEQKYEL